MRTALLAIIAAALTAAAASPVVAQSMNELSWAATNCLSNLGGMERAMSAFTKRGYDHEVEDFGIGPEGITHWYSSPDRSVNVGLQAFDGHASCRMSSTGVTVAQGVPFAKAAAEAVLKTTFTEGPSRGGPSITPANPGRGGSLCTGAFARINGGTVVATAGMAGQDPICSATAPAEINFFFTKG